MELEPEEVEDALRVTAMGLGFPSRPEEFCSSSYRLPMIGVCRERGNAILIHSLGTWLGLPAATKNCLFDENVESSVCVEAHFPDVQEHILNHLLPWWLRW